MSRGILVAVVAMACVREAVPSPADWRQQLAVVARPEPAGTIRVTLGTTVHAPTRIARDGAWLEVTALEAHGSEIVREISTGRFEELRRLDRPTARIDLRYAVALGEQLTSLRVVGDFVEALDERGVARLRTEPAYAVDAKHTVRKLEPRLTPEGVAWSADTHDLVPPIAIDPAWTATKSLAHPGAGQTAFPIGGKRVMYVASFTGETEIYDDTTSSWTSGPPLSRIRQNFPAQLDDGRIFVAAGAPGESPMAGEIFDPKTGAWKITTANPIAANYASVAPLNGTRFLVVSPGGASIYDADANTWVLTGTPLVKRRPARTLRLKDGRAMIVGGTAVGTGVPLSTAEIFDPSTGTFSAAGSLVAPRDSATVQTLNDGRVIVAGGIQQSGIGTILDTTEIYDPSTNAWTGGPKMGTARSAPQSIVMPDGRLLLAGGVSPDVLLSSTEIFDPVAKTWMPAGSLSEPRDDIAMTAIVPGEARFLAIAGYNGGYSTAVDLFQLLAVGKACTDRGECASTFCLDGVCCEKSACNGDETCGGSSSPGTCKKSQGTACTAASECGSGNCVDGVCCDRACDGVCEACDLAATKGSCATLPPGDSPHGTRAKCPGDGVCAAHCDGVDAHTCMLYPGASTACGEPSCKDGVETSVSSCDGTGKCSPAATLMCQPFACADRVCKRACAVDGDCASGYSCDARSGRCIFGATCDGDHTVVVPGSASIDCTPFRCAGAACITRCSTSDQCIAGTTCDTASSQCVVAAATDQGGGGCAIAVTEQRPRAPGLFPWLLLLGALTRRRTR